MERVLTAGGGLAAVAVAAVVGGSSGARQELDMSALLRAMASSRSCSSCSRSLLSLSCSSRSLSALAHSSCWFSLPNWRQARQTRVQRRDEEEVGAGVETGGGCRLYNNFRGSEGRLEIILQIQTSFE